MGYTTILDIVGSVIIGGFLMLILMKTNTSAVENTYNYGGDVSIQQSLSALVYFLDSDFRKIGYTSNLALISDPTKIITSADTSSIKFVSDLNNDSTLETVYYYLSPKSELSNTANPDDRFLYRVVTGASPTQTIKTPGITIFRFAYYDSLNNPISCPVSSPNKIAKILIYLKMQSAIPYNGNYVSAYWSGTKRIAVNLNNR
jgi:hypothetical protein